LLDAAFLAAHARHTGVQISLVLEEIEVSPGHPLGVVGRAVRRAAGRAGEAAAWPEVDLDIQAMRLGVEVGAHHGPWRRQAERLLHQRRIVHACLCILSADAVLIQTGAVLATVKDAARRASAVAFGHPVCRAWPASWGCKSPVQPDGGEALAKRKGGTARDRLKEAWSKVAT